jgi:hypothetical protein
MESLHPLVIMKRSIGVPPDILHRVQAAMRVLMKDHRSDIYRSNSSFRGSGDSHPDGDASSEPAATPPRRIWLQPMSSVTLLVTI